MERFTPYVLARTQDQRRLEESELVDLYLACACAGGDNAAVAVLEREYLPGALARIRRLIDDETRAEDLGFELRHKLFVCDRDDAPRIASYAGRGKLKNWLQVIAAREALMARRRPPPAVDSTGELEQLAPGPDPELDYLRQHYAEVFRAAFGRAFAELRAEERTLLRYYLVDRSNLDRIAALIGTHRATAARRLARVREHLATTTKAQLMAHLRIDTADVRSIMRLIHSELDVSIARMLTENP